MNSKNKRILISSIILSVICLGLIISYGYFQFSWVSNNGITFNTQNLAVELTSTDAINLTKSFPMSYDDAYNANNSVKFIINNSEYLHSGSLYYGIKIVPTEENTMPLEYISFDLVQTNENYGLTLDYYGDYYNDSSFILRNSKVSEFSDCYAYTDYLNSPKQTYLVRVWINDDCIIGNGEGNISPSEWANLVTSVKVVVEGSFNLNGFDSDYVYLKKTLQKSNKFLDGTENSSLVSTFNSTYNSVQDSQNQFISYLFPYNANFLSKAANIKVINFDKITTAKLEDFIENKTLNKDYFSLGDTVIRTGDVIGYFEELYTEGSEIYYSFNIVSDKIIMFPKDASNLFEFTGNTSASTSSRFNWNDISNSSSGVINYLANLEEINFNNIDTLNTVDFGYMFQNLTKLKKIDLSNFNTSIAKRMSGMFLWCESLEEIDLTNLDTSRVTRMDWMFAGTDIVETETEKNFIGLEDLDVSNVKYLDNIFSNCLNVEYLDLSNWKTGELAGFIINNKNDAFYAYSDKDNYNYGYYTYCHLIYPVPADGDYCYTVGGIMGGNTNLTGQVDNNLKYLDISNFDMSKITNLNSFFSGYTELETLKIDNWNTSNVTNWDYFLADCSSLTEFDVTKLNTSSATSMNCTFSGFGGVGYVPDFSKLKTSNVTSFIGTFAGMKNITSLNLSKLDTGSATTMRGMFRDCSNLLTLNVTGFDYTNCTCLISFLYNDKLLTNVDFGSSVDVSKVTSFMDMFGYCKALTTIDLSMFNNSIVTDLNHMFEFCTSVETIILSGLDTSNVTKMKGMFNACIKLEHIYVSNNFVTTAVTDSGEYMFNGCIKITNFTASEDVDKTRAVIYDGSNIGVLELYR